MMDVARVAGVSQATVSLILNGSQGARFSATTRNKVKRVAQELGYTLQRRGRRREQVGQSLILFIADELTTDPWTALAFEGARDKAMEFGHSVTCVISRGDAEAEALALEHLDHGTLIGVIYATVLTRTVDPSPGLRELPIVLVNGYTEDRALPSVVPGDVVGGRMATERLIAAGRRRIALITGQHGVDGTRDRLKGYRQALASADLPFVAELVRPGNWEPSSGYEQTLELMALPEPPDAIFCANDMMAVGCYEALAELGLRIPDDVSVIGFDDRDIAQFLRPGLTTLLLPQREMGALAAEMLIDRAGGLATGPTQIKLECPLVERDSVERHRAGSAPRPRRRRSAAL